MNLKLLFILCFTTTTIIFGITEQEAREIAKREAQQAIEYYAWAVKVSQSNNHPAAIPPATIHNHIHNAATSASTSNPTTSVVATKEQEQAKKDIKTTDENKIKIQEIINAYKWHIGGGIVTTCYLYTFYQIYQTNNLLSNPLSWCLFKEEIPVARLTTIKRTELFKELHLAICKKYLNSSDCDNGQKVMLKFLADLSYEKSKLESYLTYQTIIYNCYLSKIFPTFKKTEHVEESIARLNFLMDLYIEFFIIKDQNK